ncbi:MAG: glycoside hydrolase family 2 TIM barrel-domain containing protein [Chloroflexota bacterium]
MVAQPFTLGVNYWPRMKAMYWWSDFDAGEVQSEFALIRDLGLQVVRIFLLWDDFQPDPAAVDPLALANLGVVCDIAAQNGLGLDVTFFTGHMSGPNWSPRWLLAPGATYPAPYVRQVISQGAVVGDGYRNMYTDPTALDAARLLLRTVVQTYKDHPAIWMWNLGNEPDLFAEPHSDEAGRAWVREMTALIKSLDPIHPVTCGLHVASLDTNNGFRIDQVYAETDVAVMHTYPMYVPWSVGPLDPDAVPFSCALTTALCGKPTLMEEFGGPTARPGEESYILEWVAYGKPHSQFMASETELARYIGAVLPRLVDVGATGAMLWCFADYAPHLWDRPPCGESRHERHFGLVRPDGSLKPHAEVVRQFAASNPQVKDAPPNQVTPDISADDYYKAPAGHLARLYESYLQKRQT